MLSMLMIISCHIMQYYDCELAWWFNVGVQIFLCISGFLYGQKNINNVTDFYNKRLKKILIPYYLVFIPFGIIEFIFARDITLANLISSLGGGDSVKWNKRYYNRPKSYR